MSDRCRSHRCQAPIRWVRSAANDKPLPLDAEPTEAGNVIISLDLFGAEIGTVEPGAPMPRYMPHFATCVDADRFRKDHL